MNPMSMALRSITLRVAHVLFRTVLWTSLMMDLAQEEALCLSR